MLAIAQSGSNYHYLNWVPSERGPMVTHHGSIHKELGNLALNEQYYYDILYEIFSQVNNDEPIFTFSLDRNNVLFSTCFAEDMNQDLIDWHFKQTMENQLGNAIDYYHYPMETESNTRLVKMENGESQRTIWLIHMYVLKQIETVVMQELGQ